MNKEQLDSLILSTLRTFEGDCRAAGRPPLLCDFGTAFLALSGVTLKRAVAETLSVSDRAQGLVKRYLAGVPGVELFSECLSDCIRPGATAPSEPEPPVAQAVETSSPLDEECRLALLRGNLPEHLSKRVKSEVLDIDAFLQPLRDWALRGRGFRFEADAMVARGEDKTGFGFDSLKRDVRAHLEGALSEDRRLAAALYILKPFLKAPAVPPDSSDDSFSERQRDKESALLLFDIRKFASWEGREGGEQLEAAKRRFLERNPGSEDAVREAEERGLRFREFQKRAYKAGTAGRPLNPLLEELSASPCTSELERKKVSEQYEKGAAARRRFAETNRFSSEPGRKPLFELPAKGPHPNFLRELEPSRHWTILVDETGSGFTTDDGLNGRVAAVFVPEGCPLPDLSSGWHAIDKPLFDGDESVLAVCKKIISTRCGVLGVPVSFLPETPAANRWLSTVETVLELGLRLLPVEGPTSISLFVENRGSIGETALVHVRDEVLHRLSISHPARAKAIERIDCRVIGKTDHPWNGYADAVAFIWGGSSAGMLLEESGWPGSCLLSRESAPIVRRALDPSVLAPRDWCGLLSSPEAENGSSLVSALLSSSGREAQADAGLWRTFLDEAVRHLDSKAIDMALLARQLRWLKRWEPVDADLPPRVRLMWLAAELAAANHAGRTDLHESDAFRKEFDALCERLRREDCPLVAHAKLHLAVSYTNAFEFEKARDLLLPMSDWPVEAMGLRMAGRLLSSLGQHEAFLGNAAGAMALFDDAIALFRDLSEHSFIEIAQTGAYAATAAMEAATPDADERLAAYLWGGPFSPEKLVAEARCLAASAKPVEKYSHHILLCRIVELPADHPARVAYLAEKPRWSKPAVGHPWELIEFYRALLLPAGPERDARLEHACELALAEGGPTLQLIAVVIAGAASSLGNPGPREAYANLVDCCAEAIPALGESRLAALRGQLNPATRLAPLDLAKAVLPFNFR